jgi:hypothetical protein
MSFGLAALQQRTFGLVVKRDYIDRLRGLSGGGRMGYPRAHKEGALHCLWRRIAVTAMQCTACRSRRSRASYECR